MNCVIIEDESHAAEHLEYLLGHCRQEINVMARLGTVKLAYQWLKNNTADIIFLDVQLGDDLGFSIFDNIDVQTPVVFTTSYEEYAIKAFQLNSIGYLLKPILLDELQATLDKFDHLLLQPSQQNALAGLATTYQKRFLVQSGKEILSIQADEIAYFYVQNRHLLITTMSEKTYLFDGKLEALETRLDPVQFFRINRQYIVSYAAIQKMYNYTRGRVKLITQPAAKEEMIVSIDRATDFKSWLNR
jgi:two-component system, LytTR family, response regulator LytT